MVLPCRHEARVVQQVQPTIRLLTDLDVLHPQILLQHGIQPSDYKQGLVFRSAVESIRGTFIASSTATRQAYVAAVLQRMKQADSIAEFSQTSASGRHDFEIIVQHNPDYFGAIEVKGGEGNSINISRRPLFVSEFCVWSHLDGAIVNQPAHSARSIINRLTNALVMDQKLVDVLFIKDILCGTPARPCPKYPGQEDTIELQAAPDVFLFPQSVPTLTDPEPPVHTINTLRMPGIVLAAFGVPAHLLSRHLWEVHVKLTAMIDGRLRRETTVIHQGQVALTLNSRPWRP